MGAKSFTKLVPWHLVVCGVSGSVVGPPHTCVSPQLPCGEEDLLILCAVQEPKLGLDRLKLVVGLQKLSCLSKERQVSSRKFSVGGRSWSRVVPSPIVTTHRVGHELSQQLNLLIPCLEDGVIAWAKVGGGG
jgi:hypothetical protein